MFASTTAPDSECRHADASGCPGCSAGKAGSKWLMGYSIKTGLLEHGECAAETAFRPDSALVAHLLLSSCYARRGDWPPGGTLSILAPHLLAAHAYVIDPHVGEIWDGVIFDDSERDLVEFGRQMIGGGGASRLRGVALEVLEPRGSVG